MMDSFLYISARFSTMNRAKALGTGRSGGLRNGEFVGCSFLSTSHQSRIYEFSVGQVGSSKVFIRSLVY